MELEFQGLNGFLHQFFMDSSGAELCVEFALIRIGTIWNFLGQVRIGGDKS
jgi:hypothetical protein